MSMYDDELREFLRHTRRVNKLARCRREPNKGLGGAIQRGRLAKGWGVRELARAAGVAAPLLSKAERREVPNLTLHVLLKIAAALEVPVAKLLDGCDECDLTFSRVLTVDERGNENR